VNHQRKPGLHGNAKSDEVKNTIFVRTLPSLINKMKEGLPPDLESIAIDSVLLEEVKQVIKLYSKYGKSCLQYDTTFNRH